KHICLHVAVKILSRNLFYYGAQQHIVRVIIMESSVRATIRRRLMLYHQLDRIHIKIGRASCRERDEISGVAFAMWYRKMLLIYFIFFFQAEDGIRDFHVTGVQTCALPIWSLSSNRCKTIDNIASVSLLADGFLKWLTTTGRISFGKIKVFRKGTISSLNVCF